VSDSDTVVLVPMLGRAHMVAPLLESLRATCTARALFVCTPGDRDVLRTLAAMGAEHITVTYRPAGDYARKINAGYDATNEPLLFLGACDLKFHPGWLDAARAALTPGIGVVGTNDLGSPRVMAGEHSTHSLVTRSYVDKWGTIDEPGKVLHEGYAHEYVDDELVGTAKHRGAWAFAPDARVEHLHPNWGKGTMDPLYLQQQRRMRVSRQLYRTRRLLWT
jgi:hypothetical protein